MSPSSSASRAITASSSASWQLGVVLPVHGAGLGREAAQEVAVGEHVGAQRLEVVVLGRGASRRRRGRRGRSRRSRSPSTRSGRRRSPPSPLSRRCRKASWDSAMRSQVSAKAWSRGLEPLQQPRAQQAGELELVGLGVAAPQVPGGRVAGQRQHGAAAATSGSCSQSPSPQSRAWAKRSKKPGSTASRS